MNRDHRIIAFEGGEATGKATHSKKLAERLKATLFSFPRYETETGKAILSHLKEGWHCEAWDVHGPAGVSKWDMLAFQSLMASNRYEAVAEIKAALERGHVVMDRYSLSGIIYGTVEGLDPDWLRRVHESLPQPDAWILLDAPVSSSFERRPERRDRNERNREKLEKIREEYLKVFGWLPSLLANATEADPWTYLEPESLGVAKHYIVNALGSIRDVEIRICAALRGRFGRDFLDDKEFYNAEGRVR